MQRRAALLAGLGCCLALAAAWRLGGAGPESLAARKGTLTSVRITPDRDDPDVEYSAVALTGSTGVVADCELAAPRDRTIRRPAVVLLGGQQGGKHAVDSAGDFGAYVILSLDYGFHLHRGYTLLEALDAAPAARRQAFDVVPAVMLAADYLLQRPDVDPRRLILVGYSFGALYVPSVAAADPRFAAAAMVDGGGDLGLLVRSSLRDQGPVTARLAGVLAGLLLRPLEPMRCAPRVAPRPFIMINSLADQRIPRASVEELYRSARAPKRLSWIDAGHVDPGEPMLLRRTARKLIRELRAMKAI